MLFLTDSVSEDDKALNSSDTTISKPDSQPIVSSSIAITVDNEQQQQQLQGGNIRIAPVPSANPLQQADVPPEIVFFGEPRNPPPGELGIIYN